MGDGGMTMSNIITRRALVAGIAASPALALPAVASIGPDSELLRLEAEHDAARAEAKRISDRIEELTDGLPEWARGGIPLYPTAEPPFCNMGRHYADDDGRLQLNEIRKFNRNTEEIVEDWRDFTPNTAAREKRRAEWIKRRTEGRTRVKWWSEQVVAIKAVHERAGIPGLEGEFDRLSNLADDIEGVINDAKAHTLAGVAVKLRLMRQLALRALPVKDADDERNLDWQYQPGLSALRDLERLAGIGGAV
jgi:hypothetical protein